MIEHIAAASDDVQAQLVRFLTVASETFWGFMSAALLLGLGAVFLFANWVLTGRFLTDGLVSHLVGVALILVGGVVFWQSAKPYLAAETRLRSSRQRLRDLTATLRKAA